MIPARRRELNSRPLIAVCVAVVVGVAACTTVPYTGRRQLSIVGSSQELALGAQLYGTMRRRSLIAPDRRAQDAVEEVGRNIAAVAGQPDWDWELTLFHDHDQVNAWALPGGKVGLYTGILPVAKDQAGLATIIGHEVAHAIAHHSAERMSQAGLLNILGTGLGVAAGASGRMSTSTVQLLQGAYGLGAQVGVMLPFSRAQESEADEIGLILMAKAGYDPRAALGVWERMAEIERRQDAPPEFMSTHPGYGTRIARIRDVIPRALEYYAGPSARNRVLPALDQLERPPRGAVETLERANRIDQLVARDSQSPAVAYAIAQQFDITPEQVVRLANDSSLLPGETALVLAIADTTGVTVSRIVDDPRRGRSWFDIMRAANASPDEVASELDQIAALAQSAGRPRVR